MKLPCVQFTIRKIMLAVGLVAVLMWPAALARYYGLRAAAHDRQSTQIYLAMQGSPQWREWKRLNRAWVQLGSDPAGGLAEAHIIAAAQRVSDDLERRYVRRFQYHRAMASKYHCAADRPWFPISSGPTPPD